MQQVFTITKSAALLAIAAFFCAMAVTVWRIPGIPDSQLGHPPHFAFAGGYTAIAGGPNLEAALRSSPAVAAHASLPQPPPRNVAIDAYRGLVMLLMMAEVLQLSRVA